jgi:hypothetical protein
LTLSAFTLLLLQLIASAVLIFVRDLYCVTDILTLKSDFNALSATNYIRQNSTSATLSLCLAMFFPLWTQSTLHFENIASLLMILVGMLSWYMRHLNPDIEVANYFVFRPIIVSVLAIDNQILRCGHRLLCSSIRRLQTHARRPAFQYSCGIASGSDICDLPLSNRGLGISSFERR